MSIETTIKWSKRPWKCKSKTFAKTTNSKESSNAQNMPQETTSLKKSDSKQVSPCSPPKSPPQPWLALVFRAGIAGISGIAEIALWRVLPILYMARVRSSRGRIWFSFRKIGWCSGAWTRRESRGLGWMRSWKRRWGIRQFDNYNLFGAFHLAAAALARFNFYKEWGYFIYLKL